MGIFNTCVFCIPLELLISVCLLFLVGSYLPYSLYFMLIANRCVNNSIIIVDSALHIIIIVNNMHIVILFTVLV